MGGEPQSTQWSHTRTSFCGLSPPQGLGETRLSERSPLPPLGSSSLAAFTLSTILGAGLFPIGNTLRIQYSPNDVVPHAGQIAYAATTHQDNGMLLEVMAFTGDVSCYFGSIGKADARHFAKSGIGLLGRHGFDLQANPPPLGATLHGR